jgi:hypothetical protein
MAGFGMRAEGAEESCQCQLPVFSEIGKVNKASCFALSFPGKLYSPTFGNRTVNFFPTCQPGSAGSVATKTPFSTG